MNNLMQDKKGRMFLMGAVLVIAAFLILYYLEVNDSKLPPLEITKSELSQGKIPDGLPANLPMAAGNKILQNYEVRTNDGRLQSTRQIAVKQDPSAALDTYMNFFTDLGWVGEIDTEASLEGRQTVALFTKDQDNLMIVARPTGEQASSVELTLIRKINE